MSLYITGLNLPRANQELWIAIRSDGSLRYNSCGWHDSQQKAIAVQSHGRLIDADALYEDCALDHNYEIAATTTHINEYMQLKIDAAPTIIPTSE